MKKIKVTCFIAYVKVGNIYNNEVYYVTHEGWSNLSFASCLNCGELFVIDWENPKTFQLSVKQIAGTTTCPNCSRRLSVTLEKYPETFRTKDSMIGHFTSPTFIPPDEEGKVIEVWELKP